MNPFELAELRRVLASLVAFGRVSQVSDDGTRAKVVIENGLETPFLRTLKRRAKGDLENWPLESGEQVVCLFANANPGQGVILGSLLTADSVPKAPGHTVSYDDGASYSYDKKQKTLRVTLPEGARLIIEAGGAAVTVKAQTVVVDSEAISLGGDEASGLAVTTESICAFTGLPHPQGARTCRIKHA